MAAGRLIIEGWMPALDASANPYPGAKITFYENGTTTPTTVYADYELTTPLSNPVVANSAGQFASIFADASLLFSVKVETTAGGLLVARDDVRAIGVGAGGSAGEYATVSAAAEADLAGQSFVRTAGYASAGDGGGALYVPVAEEPTHEGKFQSADGQWWELADSVIVPEMFGAVGDGTLTSGGTDDKDALQAWLDMGDTRTLRLPPKGYVTSVPLVGKYNNLTIAGSGGDSIIIQSTAGENGLESIGTERLYSWALSDFCLGVAGNITGGSALYLQDVSNSIFRNVAVIAGSTSQGFLTGFHYYSTSALGGSYRNEAIGCRSRTAVSSSARAVLHDGDGITEAGTSNSNHWYGGEIRADTGIGWSVPLCGARRSDQNTCIAASFEGSTDIGAYINGDASSSQGNVVQSCRFEGVATAYQLDTGAVGNFVGFNLGTSGVGTVRDGSRNTYLEQGAVFGSAMELDATWVVAKNINGSALAAFAVDQSGESTSSGNWAFANKPFGATHPTWGVRSGGSRVHFGTGSVDLLGASAVILNAGSATGTLRVERGTLELNGKAAVGLATGPKLLTGSGTPEGVVSAVRGSLFMRDDGGAATSLYVKESGSGNTGWVAK